ncbi:hypothetical protein MGN70_012117 [Eutypa lata]|nr:hypothetical protein MGN70_012117 [Eutypa lata]
MADPLLTSLCGICRVQSPKYKCPRCGTRTCSLPCIKKHKNWSSCNGERDPTVYIPVSKLRTDAGIDHDYNFLTKIERSVEIAEKILRDERDILPQEDNNTQQPNKRARLHKGRSRGRVTLNENSRRWDRNSLQRLQRLGIRVSSVPFGMSRSKDNKSSWNKRTNSINWQVEWMVLDSATSTENDATPKPKRIMHKLLDQTPLYVGFANSMGYYLYQQMNDQQRSEEKKARKKQQTVQEEKARMEREAANFGQDAESSAWNTQPSSLQNHATTAWARSEQLSDKIDPVDERQKNDYQFFYQKPIKRSRDPEKLIPLEPTETLASILPGIEVVEFPTIVVLPTGSNIPDGYAIENKPKPKAKTASKKRKTSALVDYGSDEEDGEDNDDEGVEDGEVSDQDMVDDDTTSSSGSDSDMDTE